MTIRNTVLATVIAAAALAAVPAKADVNFGIGFHSGGVGISIGDLYDKMSPREVRRMLRHRGYHDIDFSDTGGRYFRLTAEKHGDDYFMKVDSYTGVIVHRHEI